MYFDPQDLKKLQLFKDTGELLYPLQYTHLGASGNKGYNDYTPNYNLDSFSKEPVGTISQVP